MEPVYDKQTETDREAEGVTPREQSLEFNPPF